MIIYTSGDKSCLQKRRTLVREIATTSSLLSPLGPYDLNYQGSAILTATVLDYLCCRQDHQRKGVASMLVQSGTKEADRLQMDISMVAMGLNAMALYAKYGFKIIAERQQNLEPWAKSIYYTYWVVRHPQ